jgi:hypothetical protein
MLRIRVGEVPDAILQTPIARLTFNADSRYNLFLAIAAIENAPEVQAAMNRLHLRVPARVYNFPVVQPTEGFPHLPSEISNVTMDQALDMVAKTWAVVAFYGARTAPDTYEVFLLIAPIFEARGSDSVSPKGTWRKSPLRAIRLSTLGSHLHSIPSWQAP